MPTVVSCDPQAFLIAADIRHMRAGVLVVSIVSVGCSLGSVAGMSSAAHADAPTYLTLGVAGQKVRCR